MSARRHPQSFVEGISELASDDIRTRFRHLPNGQRWNVLRFSQRVLNNRKLKKDENLRAGSARLIVALLPETFESFDKLLRDCSSPLWYEVQFTMFCALNRNDLSRTDQARVLRLIRDYLLNIQGDAGFAAWKAGDLLGDEWRDSRTVEILGELLFEARFSTGRKAALHGIEHALHGAPEAEGKKLLGSCARQRERTEVLRSGVMPNSRSKDWDAHLRHPQESGIEYPVTEFTSSRGGAWRFARAPLVRH